MHLPLVVCEKGIKGRNGSNRFYFSKINKHDYSAIQSNDLLLRQLHKPDRHTVMRNAIYQILQTHPFLNQFFKNYGLVSYYKKLNHSIFRTETKIKIILTNENTEKLRWNRKFGQKFRWNRIAQMAKNKPHGTKKIWHQ